MDQFEAARLKTLKREAKRSVLPEYTGGDAEPEPIEIPKEKPKRTQDGVFTIAVDMPHVKFAFVLTKTSILSHAAQSRLTETEIRKHIIDGLKPLLGGLE